MYLTPIPEHISSGFSDSFFLFSIFLNFKVKKETVGLFKCLLQ